MITPEQILASHQANLKTLTQLTQKTFENLEKLITLNLSTAKMIFAEVSRNGKNTAQAKGVENFVASQANFLQPLAEQSTVYHQHLRNIAQQITQDFAEAIAKESQKAHQFFESASSNIQASDVPLYTRASTTLMKNAVATANGALESVQRAVHQANDIAQGYQEELKQRQASKPATSSTGRHVAAKPAAKKSSMAKKPAAKKSKK